MKPSSNKIKKSISEHIKRILPNNTTKNAQCNNIEGRASKQKAPQSYKANNSYSVITPVYNVEKYLDDFFECMVSQTIDQKQLKLIMVDDGSTDSSTQIIKSWSTKYPNLITYMHKENGGQASARNLGLDNANSDWVTFIDPDDFVSNNYFEEVDKTLSKYGDICFATCKIVYYNEDEGEYSDKHPLSYEFKKAVSLYNVTDDFMPITLSAAKSFFKLENLKDLNLKFSTEIKPNFEDAHFLNKYILLQKEGRVAYLRKPVYYYRKREDNTSSLDAAWSTKDKFTTVLTKGKIDLLKFAKETKGYIPHYIQEMILYDLSWYFKYLVGHEEKTHRFSGTETEKQFWNALNKIFEYIDENTILNVSSKWYKNELKYAVISFFKHTVPARQCVYVDRIDFASKLMLIKSNTNDISFFCNGKTMETIQTKRVEHALFGKHFYYTYLQWFKLPSKNSTISYTSKTPNSDIRLIACKEKFSHSAQMRQITSAFKKGWDEYKQDASNIWLFMDRDCQADDNAEHLYRWVRSNHPEQKCYFAITKDSADWDRLKKDGFNLLAFGSKKFESIIRSCSFVISSHADTYVHSYFKDNFHKSKNFVFLQHGVTKDNISGWINGKPINLMITASRREYDSIASEDTSYNLTPRQVLLSGFPRHDRLLTKKAQQKSILIMPTWRNSLTGKKLDRRGNRRCLNPDFSTSLYKRAWENLLNNAKLKEIAKANNLRIAFFPHTNIYPYIENGTLTVPDYIEILGNQTGSSIQQVFADAAVLITDYSSVAFEVAYLKTQSIYYQFDAKEFFSGMHIFSKGYFDYSKDGFGPVTDTEDDVIAELEDLSNNSFAPEEKYLKRMDEFFPFRDGKCCERVCNRIKELSDGKF